MPWRKRQRLKENPIKLGLRTVSKFFTIRLPLGFFGRDAVGRISKLSVYLSDDVEIGLQFVARVEHFPPFKTSEDL
jgi:hypothetical protein